VALLASDLRRGACRLGNCGCAIVLEVIWIGLGIQVLSFDMDWPCPVLLAIGVVCL